MSVRRRILLAALAVGVVGTLVVPIWSAGPKDSTPKLEFTLLGYTNATGKFAIVKVTNRDQHAISMREMESVVDNPQQHRLSGLIFGNSTLGVGCSRTTSVPVLKVFSSVSETQTFGSATNRWRVWCYLERATLSNKMRRRLCELPWIGQQIDLPAVYQVKSDWFTQEAP